MSKFEALLQDLNTYLKLPSNPVAVKMLRKGEKPPVPAKFPVRDYKKRMVLCQAWTIARRHEEHVCMGYEDMRCAPSVLAMGFKPPIPYFTEGHLCLNRYNKTLEAGARTEALMPRFPANAYDAVLFSPLNLCAFDPDAIFLSGNPAQVMRLVHAALYHEGGRLTYSTDGRLACADLIVTPILTPGFYVVLPGHGSRRLAQTKDDEMAFTFTHTPEKVEHLREGLARTHEAGLRYPVRIHLDYEVVFPAQYDQLFGFWEKEK
ncbi:MAG: DUF169 domain-containing protein [Syntrophaceae bacterium]|nr:DUF169 domain-containing protein [Syntrophaceae bacterium]